MQVCLAVEAFMMTIRRTLGQKLSVAYSQVSKAVDLATLANETN